MPNQPPYRHPKRLVRSACAWLFALALVAILPGRAVQADPSVADLEKQIDQAWNRLEPVIEQYNQVHGQLRDTKRKAAELQSKLAPLQAEVDSSMNQIGEYAARLYKGGNASTLNALLAGNTPGEMADQLLLLDWLAAQQRIDIADVVALRDRYAQAKRPLDELLVTLSKLDADLAARKKTIEAELAKLQKLRQQAYGSSGSTGVLKPAACPYDYLSGPGGTAAKKACSLIGKPYIWAAAGPTGYDCSGLTLAAWAAAGVTLRHFTGWQWADNPAVARSELRPGDLVFFYSDLHHVGLYVGGGWMVHAPHTGDFVRMAKIDTFPIAGYRRPS
jgi:cell wall-associated NlpC family hydrolase